MSAGKRISTPPGIPSGIHPKGPPVGAPPSRGRAVPAGLVCRNCGCRHFYVLSTRAAPNGRMIRRRECRHCGRRITTYEAPADQE